MLDAPRPGPRRKRAYTRDASIHLYQTMAARGGLGPPLGFRHPDEALQPGPDHPTPMEVLAGVQKCSFASVRKRIKAQVL